MSDGVLYKFKATVPSKSQSKKMQAASFNDGVVKHANNTSWFKNYPMEQIHEQYFNCTWTHGYLYNTGAILNEGTWGDHPRAGDTADFCGFWGFDRNAMQIFVANGIVQDIQIEVMFADPAHGGNPNLYFYPHKYTWTPAGGYSHEMTREDIRTTSQFVQTGYNFTRWIRLPVTAWLNGEMGGIGVHGDPTAANSARFAGKTTSHNLNAFNTRLFIQVLK